jgi:hypothetical protein
MEVKLAAVNAMLDKHHKPRAKHMSSTPHVVLTPGFAVYHENYVHVRGDWCPKHHVVALNPQSYDYIDFTFTTVEGATYLLDLSVGGGPAAWQYNISCAPESPALTPQNGHLLYPFVAPASNFSIAFNPPKYVLHGLWRRAELTKVS